MCCIRVIWLHIVLCYIYAYMWPYGSCQPTKPRSHGLGSSRRVYLFGKRRAPGFLEHVSYGVCQFVSILGSPGKQKYGPSAQMTTPARTAPNFCAKRRAVPQLPFFTQPDFFGNSWKYRNFARMSTSVSAVMRC